MKTIRYLFAVALLFLAVATAHGQAAFFGSTIATNTLHASTNYLIAVKGDATNSPVRKISPDNLLSVFQGLTGWINPITASNNLYTSEGIRNSNSVTIAAGSGGITVTPSGAGGVMTYTISDDDAGGGGGSGPTTNIQVGRLLIVDATYGTNSTAIRENFVRTFSTVSNALLYLTNNDTLLIRGGNYSNAPFGEARYAAWTDRTNAPLRLGGVTNVIIRGENAHLWATTNGNFFNIYNCDGVRIEGITFHGPGRNLNNQSPRIWTNIFGILQLYSARTGVNTGGAGTNRNITIRDCAFYDVADHGIACHPDSANFNLLIEGNKFERIGDAYVSFNSGISDGAACWVAGTRMRIANNNIDDCNIGIELENSVSDGTDSGDISDVTITGNVLTRMWRYGIVDWVSSHVSDYKAISIVGNAVSMNPTNSPSSSDYTAIQASSNGRGIVIADNTVYAPGGVGVDLRASGGNINSAIIANNNVAVCGPMGIAIYGSSGNYILDTICEGNQISGSSASMGYAGITMQGASGTKVFGNYIHDTITSGADAHGVWVSYDPASPATTNNVINGNYFERVGGTNVLISALVTNTTVFGNYSVTTSTRRLQNSGQGTSTNLPWMDSTVSGGSGSATVDAITNNYTSKTYTNLSGVRFASSLYVGAAQTNAGTVEFNGTTVMNDTLDINARLSVNGANVTRLAGGFESKSGVITNGLNFSNLVNSRVLFLNPQGTATNVTSASASTDYVHADGSVGSPSAGSGGTNYPALIRIGTNVTVALGTRQIVTIQTNASFKLVFTGTPLNGEEIEVGVSNTASSTIYMTNTVFDANVASNVTVLPIVGTSVSWFTFKSSTNFNLGVQRWELHNKLQKEMELAVAGSNGVPFLAFSTNAAGSIITVSNTYVPMPTNAVLANISTQGSLGFTNEFVRTATTVSGAGSGSTNYLLTISTNSLNDFYLGSSNVLIYTVAGGTLGQPIYWNAFVTNLSSSAWGISFASGTNRWRFSGVYGTNAPTVLTNGTALQLSGRSDGTNTLVGYTYYAPGL